MRKLHLVGLTTDRDGLIFTARKGSKSGGYIVPLDKKVLAAIAAASEDANGEPADMPAPLGEIEVVPKRLRSESALTPREMQARLRAGRTIDEVAAEAGVDTEWVARFAVPILAEQAQVVELARSLVYAKPRLGESSEPLGSAVVQNLSDRGVFMPDDVLNEGWSAFQLHDSVWMVRFRYRSRGRDQEAHWEIDVPTGRLRARNRQASDLGYVGPDRWKSDEELDEEPAEVPPPAPAPRRRATPAPRATRRAVKAAPVTKGRTAARRPAAPPAKTTSARPTKRPAAKAAAARNVKPAPAVTRAAPRKAAAASRKAAGTSTARPAPAKAASRRRATKAVPAPEAGPAAGSGGVRMAVARVSTARVAASLAAADREPWAAAVRRASRADARPAARATGSRPTVKQDAPRDRGFIRKETVAPFQPRPLPKPGTEPPEPRIRKITISAARVPPGEGAGPPALTLPAPRRPGKESEPIAGVERPKRRRLRSR